MSFHDVITMMSLMIIGEAIMKEICQNHAACFGKIFRSPCNGGTPDTGAWIETSKQSKERQNDSGHDDDEYLGRI